MPAPGIAGAPRRPAGPSGGVQLALVSAASYGLTTTAARIAYDGGANPLTLVEFRYIVVSLLFAALVILLRRSFALGRRDLLPVLFAALGTFGVSLGYLGSVAFIPVSLAALVFYTYPLVVLAIEASIERRVPRGREFVAFLLAFVGLAFALEPAVAPDWRGLALAALASASATLMFFAVRRIDSTRDTLAVTLYVNFLGAVVIGAALAVFGPVALPESGVGWSGLIAVTAMFALAIGTQFAALRRIGLSKAALIFNLEPLIAVCAGALLLGEELTALQMLGVGLVVLALFLPYQSHAKS